jgi:uncharacterized protein HemX
MYKPYPSPGTATNQQAHSITNPQVGSNSSATFTFVVALLSLILGVAIGLVLEKKQMWRSGYTKIPEISVQMTTVPAPSIAAAAATATINDV